MRHDSLASKIYEKFTAIEKDIIEVRQFIDNAFSVYEKRGKLLTSDDLKYIAPYEDKLYLSNESEIFVDKCKNEINRSKRRRRNFVSFAALVSYYRYYPVLLSGLLEKDRNQIKTILKQWPAVIISYRKKL